MSNLSTLAKGILETIAAEDEEYFQKNGFYTMRTRANECKVLVFEIPEEQKRLENFNLWRTKNGN